MNPTRTRNPTSTTTTTTMLRPLDVELHPTLPMNFATENSTTISAQSGSTALLPCVVHNLGDGVIEMTSSSSRVNVCYIFYLQTLLKVWTFQTEHLESLPFENNKRDGKKKRRRLHAQNGFIKFYRAWKMANLDDEDEDEDEDENEDEDDYVIGKSYVKKYYGIGKEEKRKN
ncbi:hypothetical protein M0804_014201 [Polistes exclamans]|nr:hypothetical protein M0804_014202 [Polistes exclamans]KAI4475606.1 hypothetical protein M0804_014201 [Polistes exclamans]